MLDRLPGHRHRVADPVARLRGVHLDTGPAAEHLELPDRVGPLKVGRDQQRLVALPLQPAGASLPASVVLPEPCRPASMITVGGCFANCSRRASPPSVAISSSCTILMTCWAGLSACDTSAPRARSFSRAMNALTTGSATSASSSASRISRAVASMSASVSRPLLRSLAKMPVSRSLSVSNTAVHP